MESLIRAGYNKSCETSAEPGSTACRFHSSAVTTKVVLTTLVVDLSFGEK